MVLRGDDIGIQGGSAPPAWLKNGLRLRVGVRSVRKVLRKWGEPRKDFGKRTSSSDRHHDQAAVLLVENAPAACEGLRTRKDEFAGVIFDWS